MMTLVIYMINIGLTGWGDHYSLYEDLERQTDKLKNICWTFSGCRIRCDILCDTTGKKYIEMDKRNA